MLRLVLAELVAAMRAVLSVDDKLVARYQRDHRAALGTERTIAAHAARERLGLERELDCAAVATGCVGLRFHFGYN